MLERIRNRQLAFDIGSRRAGVRAPGSVPTMSPMRVATIIIFISVALSVRSTDGEGGAKVIQVLLLAITFGGLALQVVLLPVFNFGLRALLVPGVVIIFLIDSVLVALVSGRGLTETATAAVPFVLLLIGYSAATRALKGGEGRLFVWNVMVASTFCNSALNALTQWQVMMDNAAVRYHALPSDLFVLVAFVALGAFYRDRAVGTASRLCALLLFGLSLNRTVLMMLGLAVVTLWLGIGLKLDRRICRNIVYAGFFGALLLLPIVLPFLGDVADLWTQRFTIGEQLGADPSLLTRQAEWRSQADSIFGSPLNAAFGVGIGHKVVLDPHIESYVEYLVQAELPREYEFGHNSYLTLIYLGGFSGLLFTVLIFLLPIVAVLNARRCQQIDIARAGMVAALTVFLPNAFFGGVIGDRFGAFAFGVCAGLLVGTLERRAGQRRPEGRGVVGRRDAALRSALAMRV